MKTYFGLAEDAKYCDFSFPFKGAKRSLHVVACLLFLIRVKLHFSAAARMRLAVFMFYEFKGRESCVLS